MNTSYKIIIFFLSILNGMLATPLLAQYSETITSDRPGISISPYSVGKNVFQLQSGFILGGLRTDSNQRKSDILAESTVIRFGLTRTLEVSTAFTFRRDKTEYRYFSTTENFQSGLSQADVGFRANLYEGHGLVPTVGFQTHLKLNILSKDYDTDYPGIVCLLATTQNLAPGLTLTTNFGGVWDNNFYGPGPQGMYTLNLAFPIAGKLGGFVENYGSFQDGDFLTLFDAGLGFLLNNNLQLDISGGYGKNHGVTEYFVDAGVSWRFFVTKNHP